MKHPFYAFEGVDAAGKTTPAKLLAEHLSGEYYHNPPEVLRGMRTRMDSSPPTIRYLYYLLGNFVASEEIKVLLESRPVVADWYIYSTVAFHSAALDRNLDVPEGLLLPDKIIHVTASLETIEARLRERQDTGKYSAIDFLRRVIPHYERLFAPQQNVIRIDTTYKSPEETARAIITALTLSVHSKQP